MAKQTTKVKVGEGTTEVSVGETTIPVERDGTVEVPSEAVPDLVRAGITEVKSTVQPEPPAGDAPAAPPALAKLVSPHGGPGSLSWGGESYQINEAGEVEVPHAAVSDLISHGFKLAPAEG